MLNEVLLKFTFSYARELVDFIRILSSSVAVCSVADSSHADSFVWKSCILNTANQSPHVSIYYFGKFGNVTFKKGNWSKLGDAKV